MRLIFLLLVSALFAKDVTGQQIELGKGNLFHRKEVSAKNFGLSSSPNDLIYFRTTPSDRWQRAGFLGRHLRPYLNANPLAMNDFRRYRQTKWGAGGCYAGLMASEVFTGTAGSFWLLSSLTGESDKELGIMFLAGLGASVGLGISYHLLRRKADRHLQHAVQTYNGISTSDTQAPAKGWQIYLRPTTGHNGFGLTLTVLRHQPSSFIVQTSSF